MASNAKEIKGFLKNARDAIKNKEYKEALKNCKAVMKLDNDNYNALVFIGVAAGEMDQPEQARLAYEKAISSKPDQPLAWQGLANFFEKFENHVDHQRLMEVYEQLCSIYKQDEVKYVEILKKSAKLAETLALPQKVVQFSLELIRMSGESVECGINSNNIWRQIIGVLSVNRAALPDTEAILTEAYSVVLAEGSLVVDVDTEKICEDYLKMLKTDSNFDKLINECVRFMKLFNNNKYMNEIVCESMIEKCFKMKETLNLDYTKCIEEASNKYKILADLDEENPVALLGLGQCCFMKKDFNLAKEHLKKSSKLVSTCMYTWIYLTKTLVKLHKNLEAETSAKHALKLPVNQDGGNLNRNQIKMSLAEAMSNSRSSEMRKKSIAICQRLLDEEPGLRQDIYVILITTYCSLGDTDEADKLLQELTMTDSTDTPHIVPYLKSLVLIQTENYKEALESVENALSVSLDDRSCVHFTRGLILSRLQRVDESFQCFLQAAKLDPYYSDTFHCLGKYYMDTAHDLIKARRCFQKSFDLDSTNAESGARLGDVLYSLGEEDAALNLYLSVTKTTDPANAQWAWLRLGLFQNERQNYAEAIHCFQYALRADANNHCLWECLGEAYYNRGSHTAGLKSFTRAAELDPDCTYCMYHVAAINQVLGKYREAIQYYESLLEKCDYTPALKGLGECYLSEVQTSLSEFLHLKAVDKMNKCLEVLSQAVVAEPGFCCLWKLMADCCMLVENIPSALVSIRTVPVSILESTDNTGTKIIGKEELLHLAVRCYRKALKIQPHNSGLSHDIGYTYYTLSVTSRDVKNQHSHAESAVKWLKAAVKMDPSNPRYWNTLGVTALLGCTNDPAFAQHCFIKSCKCDKNNPTAWTNLGCLYLKHNQEELAHRAFKVAQSLDPQYISCWIGQAIVAEKIGHVEAMDLYRHTTELGNHVESAIGYATWVCSVLQDPEKLDTKSRNYAIDRMDAVAVSIVCLSKYVDRVDDDLAAYIMLGYLLEKEKLHSSAVRVYNRALDLAWTVTYGDDEKMDVVKFCLGRALGSLGQNVEAVEQLRELVDTRRGYISTLALALFQSGQRKESYQTYENLYKLVGAGEKSAVLTALGIIAYRVGDLDRAKTLLFKSTQEKPACMEGLLALCAMGLTKRDFTLSSAALAEILKHGSNEEFSKDVVFLSSSLYSLQGRPALALKCLQKSIHKNPCQYEPWTQLAWFILTSSLPGDFNMAALSCRCAIELSQSTPAQDPWLYLGLSILHSDSVCDVRQALRSVQRFVHCDPSSMSGWMALASSCFALNATKDHDKMMTDVSYLQLCVSRCRDANIQMWLLTQLILSLIRHDSLQDAKQVCHQSQAKLRKHQELPVLISLSQYISNRTTN